MDKIANLEIGKFKIEMGKVNLYIVRVYQNNSKVIEVECKNKKSATEEFKKIAVSTIKGVESNE